MTMIDRPTFVVQRKLNQPLETLELVVREPRLLRAGAVLAHDGRETVFKLDRPFGLTLPAFGHAETSWSAPVSARTRRGRAIEAFDLELNRWDASSTELLVRPRAARPDRWKSRRLRRYFRVAHAAADVITGCLGQQALELTLVKAGARDDRPSPPSRKTRNESRDVSRLRPAGAHCGA